MTKPTIKSLIWSQRNINDAAEWDTWDAYHCGFKLYTVKKLGLSGHFGLIDGFDIKDASRHSCLSAAQAAAQRDWEEFISNALVSCPPSS